MNDRTGKKGVPSMARETIPRTDALTGGPDERHYLFYQLVQGMRQAKAIDIMVSFLMESGMQMLIGEMVDALERGVRFRILTGRYLGITQPAALYLIRHQMGDSVDLRFYDDGTDSARSFHPKTYFLHYGSHSDLFIGSSNISESALTDGIEWNYRLASSADPGSYKMFFDAFEDLFENHSVVIDRKVLRQYSLNWRQPAVQKDIKRLRSADGCAMQEEKRQTPRLAPRGDQWEALYTLRNTRDEGADRALVQAATGAGKTCIAAFDSLGFDTVLFVAHRQEILRQAARTFESVRGSDDYGFFDGESKCTDKSVIFASVATLGRAEYLNDKYFAPDRFEYIVIDEFHHAVTDQYQRIAAYFHPSFLLGLTATPERMDGRNIYELCDYNVPYELSLKSAINKGVLVPFRYYGIYDDTDYSGLHLVKGHYEEKDLNGLYIGNQSRSDLIFKNYLKYHSLRALGFCCSRAHAEEMAKDFSSRGIPSAAVYSNSGGRFSMDRDEAARRLSEGSIRVVFSVDMFNEGVDIPSVDMVMFLRPTDSPVVFLQQLGRGLRCSPGKNFLTVLDFIGNYEKAGSVRFLLTGDNEAQLYASEPGIPNMLQADAIRENLPDDCQVEIDLRLIDLFERMGRKHMRIRDLIKEEFFRVEERLGRRPSRKDMFTYSDGGIYSMCLTHSQENIFRDYLSFLRDINRLSPEEEKLIGSAGHAFLRLLETTSMTKVYKMPVLSAFCSHGKIRTAVTEDEILASWKGFFGRGANCQDLKGGCTPEEYRKITDKDHLRNIMKNPVHFLLESGKGFFVRKEGFALALREDLGEFAQNKSFIGHMVDIIEYRTMDYYQRRYKDKKERQ